VVATLKRRSLSENYVNGNICFFQQTQIKEIKIYTNLRNYRHLFDTLVIDKMWLLSKHATVTKFVSDLRQIGGFLRVLQVGRSRTNTGSVEGG
jgi:hypothetical protein